MTSGKVILSLLLAGAAIGVAAVILLESQECKTSRRFLSKKGKGYTDELEETFSGFIDGIAEKLESIKEEAIRIANNQRFRQEKADMDATKTGKQNAAGK